MPFKIFIFFLIVLSHSVNSDTIVLSNGDVLSGKVLSKGENTLTLAHNTLGTLELTNEQINSVVMLEPTTASESSDNKDPEVISEAEAIAQAAPSLHPYYPWKTALELGLNGSEGNSQSRNIHAGLLTKQETPELRRSLEMAYDSSETDNATSRDEFFATFNQDWLINESPWYYFAMGRFDWDDFKDWDYRMSLSAGAGYTFIENKEWSLRSKAGLGANREFGGEDDDIKPEGLLGGISEWTLSEHHKIELSSTFYPELDQLGEYRNITELNWVNKLNSHMRMKIGLANEYESDVPSGIKHNDFKYTTSLSWEL